MAMFGLEPEKRCEISEIGQSARRAKTVERGPGTIRAALPLSVCKFNSFQEE
jgi:hypothetical protein